MNINLGYVLNIAVKQPWYKWMTDATDDILIVKIFLDLPIAFELHTIVVI